MTKKSKLRLENVTARSRLKPQREPYWQPVHRGTAIGYYKAVNGDGSWWGRVYRGGGYERVSLGPADDTGKPESGALSYSQAVRSAIELADSTVRSGRRMSDGGITVETAVSDYLTWFKGVKKPRAYRDTERRAELHILPKLGSRRVADLTAREIRRWHHAMATANPRTRGVNARNVDHEDPDTIRARRASANRVLTVLKAALNHAWRDGLVDNNAEWSKVRPFQGVDIPRVQHLTTAEATRLVNACDKDFRPMVRAALLTGCRYGELGAMRVSDFNPDAGTVTIWESKSGKSRHVPLTEEGQKFHKQAIAGKPHDALIFTKASGGAWEKSDQIRLMIRACKAAKITPAISFHALRHSYGSLLAAAGVPLQVIAHAMGHADTRMTEKHYAHLQPSYVADTIRANLPVFGGADEDGSVVSLTPKATT